MDAVYSWVRNIIYYIIWVNIIMNILPDKNNEKYLKLFTGIVLIILIIKPFTGGESFDDKIKKYMDSIELSQEAGELKKDITGMEADRLKKLILQYKEAIAVDISGMAEQFELSVVACEIMMEDDKDSENFGKVEKISIKLNRTGNQDTWTFRKKIAEYYGLEVSMVNVREN